MSDCILWCGEIDRYGYGKLSGKLAHRIVYESEVGPIPKDLVIDHLCRTRACVNVEHMEIVTRAENVLRGIGHTAVKCHRGHPLAGDNLGFQPNGRRYCRTCKCERERARRRVLSNDAA